MPPSDNSIASPTPRSLELVTRVLSAFPALQLILAYSHRADIIHLARTCRTLASMLAESVSPLRRPFPRCTVDLASCQDCQAIVCAVCQREVRELESPSAMLSRLQIYHALVIAPDTEEVRSEVLGSINTAMRIRGWPMGGVPVLQDVECNIFCASCFRIHRAPNREMQIFNVPVLQWSDVPNTHTLCTCTDIHQAQCDGDKRLVAIDDVPVGSHLVAMVMLPPQLWSTMGTETVVTCALYVQDALLPVISW
ncbi:hypothetical protein BGX38DRAFT_1330208 [Terfezia claveryi]|nr:hypothetical protein BGX38DRAFT_1330208 [Terfezia claveryi]